MTASTQLPKTTTISERMADYVVGLRYDDLPPSVVERAKDLLVFHLGLALRGRQLPNGRRAVQAAMELSGTGGSCSIVGERQQAGLLEAVLANSSLMASVGLFDLLFPSGGIPGIIVHPAAWGVGETTKASGREVLTAVVVGYDVMAKLHNGKLPYELAVPRPTKAAVEPFGAAATAARLLGLSREQTVSAMGHAGQSVIGIYEGMQQQWLMHPLTSRNGVQAATLAKADLPGTSTIVEGSHGVYRTFFLQDVPDSVHDNLATLGDDFEIAKARTTRYPVSATNHLPIQLSQQLVAEHALTPDRIAAIDVVLPSKRESREAIYGTYPKGPSTVVAIALTDGRFDPARFDEPFDADVLAMRDRVRLRFEEGRAFFYARVEVTTTDGQRHTAEDGGDMPPDSPPIDWDEWLAGDGVANVTDDQLTRLADLMRHLEDVTDVSEVMACIRPVEAS